MANSIFGDQEMLDEILEMSKKINERAIKENKSENEIIQQMEAEAFENIRQLIEEEIESNKERELGGKYGYITELGKVSDTATHLDSEGLAIRFGERITA
jgi:hypothetical protein